MQTIQTSLTVLDDILAVNLNISLWTARKKMIPEDFGGVTLPPEDLATLGSKRIADPDKLKIFNTLKARSFNFLDKHGVRFMCGWAIPEEKAGLIVEELVNIRSEFFREKEAFLETYEENLASWIVKHDQWADIIRNSVVSSDYVRARMDFRWQLFKVAPLMRHSSQTAITEAGLAEEVEGLGNTLFTEISRSADEIWKKVYLGKVEVTHKALSPLKALYEKLIGLTFIEPHVAPVAEIIDTTLKQVPPKGNISGTSLFMLQGLVCLLRDSGNLLIHAQKLIEGYDPTQLVQGLTPAISPEEVGKLATLGVSVEDTEDMSDLPELPPLPAKPVLPNMGLW